MPTPPAMPHDTDAPRASSRPVRCPFLVDKAAYAAFEAAVSAPPRPSEALRRAMQALAPWEPEARPDRSYNLLPPQQ